MKKTMTGPEFDAHLRREIKKHIIRASCATNTDKAKQEITAAKKRLALLRDVRQLNTGICYR